MAMALIGDVGSHIEPDREREGAQTIPLPVPADQFYLSCCPVRTGYLQASY